MEIVSVTNSKIKELKKQKAKNHFLLFLDTPNMIKEALENGYEIVNILVENGKDFEFLKKIETKQTEKIIIVSGSVLKQFSNLEKNAGIVGIFEMKKNKGAILADTNILILDRVQDPGNVGTLLRSALGADFKKVFLIDCAHLSNEKVVRSSAGAIFKLDCEEVSLIEFENKFKTNYKNYKLFYADMNGKNIFETKLFSKTIALVLGNEGSGVCQKIKDMAEGTLSLPMKNGLESLNVAVSGSLIMYLISFGG